MSSIIKSFKCCFPNSSSTTDKEAQISNAIPLNKQTTGFTANSSRYSNEQQNKKAKINLDQGEKHYSFQVSESLFSSLIQHKQPELNHISTINSDNVYALTSNIKDIKESPTSLNVSNQNDNINSNSNPNEDKIFSINNTVILDKDIENNKKLKIEDHEGELLNGKTLIINAAGLEGGKRQLRDGYTFFGTQLKKDNCIINDFIVKDSNNNTHDDNVNNDNNNDNTSSSPSRLFAIIFELKTQTYYLRSLNDQGSSNEINHHLLLQINDTFPIKSKSYFSFCLAAISIEPINNNDSILISILNSELKKEYSFDKTHKEITIGRKKSCDVYIQMTLVSKIHCTVSYNVDSNTWTICDGYKNKKSTNGLWYLIKRKHPINQETSFIKIGTDIIKIMTIEE